MSQSNCSLQSFVFQSLFSIKFEELPLVVLKFQEKRISKLQGLSLPFGLKSESIQKNYL